MFTTYLGMIGSDELAQKPVDPSTYTAAELDWCERWLHQPGERFISELGRKVLLTVVEANASAAMLAIGIPEDLLAGVLIMSGISQDDDQRVRGRFQERLDAGNWEIEHSVQRISRPCCYVLVNLRPTDDALEENLTMASIELADRLAAAFLRKIGSA